MRSKKQQFYDRMYYGFENKLYVVVGNIRIWKRMLGVKFDRAFYDYYHNQVCPYWAKFGVKPPLYWIKYYYQLNGTMDPRYIPDNIHVGHIIPHFDKDLYVRSMVDKNLHSLVFPGVKRPDTVYKHIDGYFANDDFTPISREEAFSRCLEPCRYIIKPTVDTGTGSDIAFFSGDQPRESIQALLAGYESIDYIVQKVVRQHPELAKFNPSSLNTIRMVTLFLNGKPHILSSILRIGAAGNEVDNVSKGGYQCTIRPDGTLEELAYTHYTGKDEFVKETKDGLRFEGFAVPSWDKIYQTTLDLCTKLPHLKFIGWDLGVDENGEVVLIEFNCQIGQNQATCGPTFGDLTDEVLSEVFQKRMQKTAKRKHRA